MVAADVADENQEWQQDVYRHDASGTVDGLMVTAIDETDDDR